MKNSGFYEVPIPASGSANLPVSGDYFKIMSATGLVSIKSTFGELENLVPGQGLEDTPFEFLTLKNMTASAITVKVFVGDQKFIDGMSGSIDIQGSRSGIFSNTQKTVTSTSALFDAANADRRYLLIQNNSLKGTLYLGFAPGVTATNGLKITPGGYYEPNVIPTCAIYAVGDIASNPDIVLIEG